MHILSSVQSKLCVCVVLVLVLVVGWSDLSTRLWNEAFNLHSVSRSWEWRLPQLLHEWVDHGHGFLPPLLHLVKYLHTQKHTQTHTHIIQFQQTLI